MIASQEWIDERRKKYPFEGLNKMGKELRQIRLKRDMVLGDLANLLQVSSSQLSSWEFNIEAYPINLIFQIADALSLSEIEYMALLRAEAEDEEIQRKLLRLESQREVGTND